MWTRQEGSPMTSKAGDPHCGLCGHDLGSRPWPMLVMADESVPGQLLHWLAEGRMVPLALCAACDEALMAVVGFRRAARVVTPDAR